MIPITQAISSVYSWSTLPHSRIHEVRCNGRLVGKLERPSAWKSNYEAETTSGKWIFRRSGFLGTGAEILDAATAQPIASFKQDWPNRGLLTFSDGQTFTLHCKGWWHPTWSITTQFGEDLLFLHTREKTAEICAAETLAEEHRNLLLMFSLYHVLQAEEDAASAAMVAS